MGKKLLFLVLGLCILLLLINGLHGVYSVEGLPVTKKSVESRLVKPENKIGIAHTEIFGVLERPQVIFDHNKHTEALKKERKKESRASWLWRLPHKRA